MKQEEHELQLQLDQLDASISSYQKDTKDLKERLAALEEEEEMNWRRFNAEMMLNSEKERQVQKQSIQMKQLEARIEQLHHTSVLNEVFRINQEGEIASINGFRMGKLDSHGKMLWDEQNAAMGQCTLLLWHIQKSMPMQKYKLLPMGMFSRIERVEGGGAVQESLELFYTPSDSSILLGGGRLWGYKRYDHALCLFIDCLDAVLEGAKSKDFIKPPFKYLFFHVKG